jgi:D-serine dehydratase
MPDLLTSLSAALPVFWSNPLLNQKTQSDLPEHYEGNAIGLEAIRRAEKRFKTFAPLLAQLFPELATVNGQIESDLVPVPAMQNALELPSTCGQLWVKADHALAVAGSVKARGGFHEVLEVTEQISQKHNLLSLEDDILSLLQAPAREVFSQYQIAVGSTGNLGMSIGVMAAALGFRAVVHMSSEAKNWKKTRLRSLGVQVVEHFGDYEQAVFQGRLLAESDPLCHFVDDERSTSLFLGYAASAFHFQKQLQERCIQVDAGHPLCLYIPCGVGGAPSGIAWGLHHVFGRHVRCYFAEPVQSPCFLVQMLTGMTKHPSIYDFGLNNRTEADGLAVPRASLLAAECMKSILAGVFTVEDATLFQHLQLLFSTEGIRIEPSAAAGFSGIRWLADKCNPLTTHVVWTTGGSLVPDAEFQKFLAWPRF